MLREAIDRGRLTPFQYQWYKDEVATGSSTSSSCLGVTLFDVGTTVSFKVEVTDASGLMTTAKHTVDVVEECTGTNPDCGPVEQQ